jgi:hypothetical protein
MNSLKFTWVSEAAGVAAPVYMGHAYQSMLGKYDGSESRILKCMARGEASYLPMLVKELGNGRKEAYSAYGYGGLIGALTLSDKVVDHLRDHLASESILALFIRHSPFLANQNRWPIGSIEFNRFTYARRLHPSENFDAFLIEIRQKLRWSVNYARRAGLRISFHPLSECSADRIRSFYRVYSGVIQKKQTSDYYIFSEDLFLEHSRALTSRCELAEIIDGITGEQLAGVFFLIDDTGWVHYHLSAATPRAMKLQGMEFLMVSALQRYGNSGCTNMHLGGGHSSDESDGLSRFKLKFSTERLDYCCTKLICDKEVYQHERERVSLKNPSYFLISDARGQW